MGDYGAEPLPDEVRAQILSRNYNFIPSGKLLTDEWNIDDTHRVNNFADGTGNIKVKIKSNPFDIPVV